MSIPHRSTLSSARRLGCAFLFAVLLTAFAACPASAAGPVLELSSFSPDHVTPGKNVRIAIIAQNAGDAPLNGELSLNLQLPVGVKYLGASPFSKFVPELSCVTAGQLVECTTDATGVQTGGQVGYQFVLSIASTAAGDLSGEFEVSGGGSPGTQIEPLVMSTSPLGPFEIEEFHVDLVSPAGFGSNQAAAVPGEIRNAFSLPSEANENLGVPFANSISASESFRNVVAHVPAGLIGNPAATPQRCTADQLATPEFRGEPDGGIPTCPLSSQIGLVQINGTDIAPLYNMVPPKGSPAAFSFVYLAVPVSLFARVRPSDNGIDVVTEKAVSSVPITKIKAIFWGVPGDPSHDNLRGTCLQEFHGYNPEATWACPFDGERIPFLRNPTSCSDSPLRWDLQLDTYQRPEAYHSRSDLTAPIEGCGDVPFNPLISLAPSERSAQRPTGLDVELKVPQDNGPDGLAQADLRAAEVTLPQGATINPGSADGLGACSDAQLRLGLAGPSQCPDASKLGSVEVDTPLLEEPIGGSVFLRSQASNDPASGEMYRLAIELRSDERGVAIKLPGSLRVDPATGQLKTSFGNLPQLPFESMRLHFKTGPRAPLTTPSTCGSYSTEAELTSWSGKTVSLDPSFTLDQNCDHPPFAPGFQAGVQNNTAGAFSPLVLRVTRDPGQPNLSRIAATLPEGELAKLAGVPICGNAQASSGACPAGSRIGSVVTAIGEGSSPLYLPQAGKSPTNVYLAAPYKGAPYSVVTEVPAQAGPFDLGKVLVRSALRVDPETTQASVVSDPLPQIFGGIPVAYRDVRVLIDRPEFAINPTDCEPTAVTGTIGSAAGGSAAVSDRFQVADCARLAFEPKLSLKLKGKTRRGGNPALTAVLTMPQKGPGANIAKAVVTLPKSEFIAQDHLNNVCTRVQYAANGGGGAGCPKGSVYGRARAFSPLLDNPLEGKVYLRSNGGDRELPDLVASLDGPIDVDLVGYVDSDKRTGGLRTTFAKIPDAPVSKFVLKMGAGKKSLLENSTNICRGERHAIAQFDGQNGKISDFRPLVQVACGKGARKR